MYSWPASVAIYFRSVLVFINFKFEKYVLFDIVCVCVCVHACIRLHKCELLCECTIIVCVCVFFPGLSLCAYEIFLLVVVALRQTN